jgi:hypothetical protein
MELFVTDASLSSKMGKSAAKRVSERFTDSVVQKKFDACLSSAGLRCDGKRVASYTLLFWSILCFVVIVIMSSLLLLRRFVSD